MAAWREERREIIGYVSQGWTRLCPKAARQAHLIKVIPAWPITF